MTILLIISLLIYTVSVLLLTYIVVRGPTVSDKVLSANVALYTSSVILAITGIIIGSEAMAICTIILILWAYALDLYFSKYLERGELGEQ